ncbi:MAG: triose-phosphate isomerase [Christensenellales bacterium]|jgi:triosephosphate isomerase
MRKPIIAGNWKMNKTASESRELIRALIPLVKDVKDVDIIVCPPFVNIEAAAAELKDSNIKLGVQNMHFEESGAFTGEIAPAMLKELGVEYVIIGHSERRQYFGETDEAVNKKVKTALKFGLKPIVCVGEKLEEREAGITSEVVCRQTKLALLGLSDDQAAGVVLAYEPIWAIGTGKTATADDANDTIAAIRNAVKEAFSKDVAEKIRIQYGGSMKPSNAAELMAKPEIDGGLIGGASLKAEDFSLIVKF